MFPRWLFLTFALALPAASVPAAPPPPPATPLAFSEFFEPSPLALVPSEKLRSLDGKRVKIVGWMARMEEPPQGVFFLCPRPTFCDEEGGGTADLPPTAVRVLTRSAAGKPVRFLPRALVVTGILSVGPKTESDGTTSNLRLILDGFSPQEVNKTKEKSKNNGSRENGSRIQEKPHATTMQKRGDDADTARIGKRDARIGRRDARIGRRDICRADRQRDPAARSEISAGSKI